MKSKLITPDFPLLALSGLAAGLANGLLGAGGGIIITFAFARLLRGKENAGHDIFANVVAAMLPMTAVSAVIYALGGKLNIKESAPFLLPAVLGGIIGALLLGKINVKWLRRIFAVLVIFSGARMIF